MREITRDESPRLMTLRTQVLVAGAILGADGRKKVLRLGVRGPWPRAVLPRCSNASLSLLLQLWSQFPIYTKKPNCQAMETAPNLRRFCFTTEVRLNDAGLLSGQRESFPTTLTGTHVERF